MQFLTKAQKLALCCLLVAGVPAMAAEKKPQLPPIRDKWAVVIGVSKFADPSIEPIKFGKKNAGDMTAVLKDPESGRFFADHVITLTDAQATKAAIESSLLDGWLLKKALPRDLIVVYACTRAAVADDGSDLILLGADGRRAQIKESGVSLTSILSEIRRRTQCRQIVCLLDTSPLETGKGTALTADNLAKATKVVILTANKFDQPSLSSPMGGSFFLSVFSDGLRTGGGTMPLDAVAQYVEQSVPTSQKPTFAFADELADVSHVVIGTPVKNPNPAANVAVGHPVDDLAMNRPDLFHEQKGAKNLHAAADDDNDEQGVGNVDFSSYMTKMKKDIQAKWNPPKGFANRRVVAVFTIKRDGTIENPSIVEGAGEAIDQAALNALQAASPLDALPKGAPKSVQMRYVFEWKVSRDR